MEQLSQDLSGNIPHLRKSGKATQLIVDGKPFIMLAGEVHNSSSSSLAYMHERVWYRLLDLHCNTALLPVSWELVEPREGQFDFGLIDGLIEAARKLGLRLIPLWFGTWKNTWSSYAPGWVKTDLDRFPRAQPQNGRNCGAISCLSEAACDADARAFAALMRHIREIDGQEHTVIMVQVENETGLLGAGRDHSDLAEERFNGPVPSELMSYLQEHKDSLIPELHELWEASGFPASGTWAEVFGDGADEVFMAWHIGRYLERVTRSGQAEYPLPMFANAWLVQHDEQKPGEYPSGGPVSRVMDIWRCAAPSIALLAPDIYLPDFAGVCAKYTRSGNPLLIPEARRDETASANAFYAFGQHDALCFAPFGIEGTAEGNILADTYLLLSNMMPILAEHQGTGRMIGILQGDEETQEMELGNYRLRIRFPGPREAGKTPGGGLIISVSPEDYIVAGHGFSVDFLPGPGGLPHVDFLSLDEGEYRNGQWIQGRRLNGDEYRLRLRGKPQVHRAKLYSYA